MVTQTNNVTKIIKFVDQLPKMGQTILDPHNEKVWIISHFDSKYTALGAQRQSFFGLITSYITSTDAKHVHQERALSSHVYSRMNDPELKFQVDLIPRGAIGLYYSYGIEAVLFDGTKTLYVGLSNFMTCLRGWHPPDDAKIMPATAPAHQGYDWVCRLDILLETSPALC